MNFTFDVISAEEHDRLQLLYQLSSAFLGTKEIVEVARAAD